MIEYAAYLVAAFVGVAIHEWSHAAVFYYYDVEHWYGISWSDGRMPIPNPSVRFHPCKINEPRVMRLSASAPLLLVFTASVVGYANAEVWNGGIVTNAVILGLFFGGIPSPSDMEGIVYPRRILERGRGHYRQWTNHSDVEGYAHVRHELHTPEPIQR